ncbi:MAG TPA: HAD family phosphatase [Thermoanaerobaculia bacterium]|nr:HAD family phosphatase [Thermoanaerobaculia bacterium]
MCYRAIVFDFFGVICSEVAPFWLARHFSESEAKRVKADIVHAADLGEISQGDMLAQLGAMTNIPPQQIRQEWDEYVRIDVNVVNVVRSLKAQFRLGLLTNSASEFVRSILQRHQLETAFDAIVVSSEVRSAKPDNRIYELMLAALAVPASTALMIDDNPDNVAGAISVGMQGIVFTSIEQLETAMSKALAR